jgi:protease I
MSKRVLIVTGDGGESFETLYAVQRLREAGYEALVAAPAKRRLHLVIHDFEPGWDTYVERTPGYGVVADLSFEEVTVSDYDAVLLIGGRAPEYLRNRPVVLDLVKAFERQGKWIFAICHGIQILVTAGLVAGRSLTCYEHVRPEVEMGGGSWVAQQAVRDGRMVTGQTWESHPEFYQEVMACLREASVS